MLFLANFSQLKGVKMKTLKIKKKHYKRWSEVGPGVYLCDRVECRYYIVQMSEKEYFKYIQWKGIQIL